VRLLFAPDFLLKNTSKSITYGIREKQQWINIKFTSNNERIEKTPPTISTFPPVSGEYKQ